MNTQKNNPNTGVSTPSPLGEGPGVRLYLYIVKSKEQTWYRRFPRSS